MHIAEDHYQFENINKISTFSSDELSDFKTSSVTISLNNIDHKFKVTWDEDSQRFGVENVKQEGGCINWIRDLFCRDEHQLDEASIKVAKDLTDALNHCNKEIDPRRKFADHYYSSACASEIEQVLSSGTTSSQHVSITTIGNDQKKQLIISPSTEVSLSGTTLAANDRSRFLLYGFDVPRARLELRLNKYCNLKENAIVEKVDEYNHCLGLEWASFNFLTYCDFLSKGRTEALSLMKSTKGIKDVAENHHEQESNLSARIDEWIDCLQQNIEKFDFSRKLSDPKFLEFIAKNYKDTTQAQQEYEEETVRVTGRIAKKQTEIQEIKERIGALKKLSVNESLGTSAINQLLTDSDVMALLSAEEFEKISNMTEASKKMTLAGCLTSSKLSLKRNEKILSNLQADFPAKPLSFDELDQGALENRLKEHPSIILLQDACRNPNDPSLLTRYDNLSLDEKDLLDTVLKNAFFRHTSKLGLTLAHRTGTIVLFSWNRLRSKIELSEANDVSKIFDYEVEDLDLNELHEILNAELYKRRPPAFYNGPGHHPITLSEMDELGRLLQDMIAPKFLLIEKITDKKIL